jgi:hypothetical protein
MMSEMAMLESRLEAVERRIAELSRHVLRAPGARPWYEDTIGSMKEYPEFAEVVKLGRELRKADGAAE